MSDEDKFSWKFAFGWATPIGLVKVACQIPAIETVPIIVLVAVLLAIVRLRKFHS
jgi:hypothetical protein